MARINILPKDVAQLIAAGEVVERPMSVVKELTENAVDAGATRITVEIRSGGVRYIRVADNGCGIDRADLPVAFISHATSKIKTADDLDSIFTLGFRGEALPSIAAVSHVQVLTRTANETIGTSFSISGDGAGETQDAGCPEGTTVIVRDLFYNTPARMKFLKKDVTEANYISDILTRLALSHPEIRFSLIRDGKQTLSTPGSGDLFAAIRAVFGKEMDGALLPVEYEYNDIKLSGYISRPLNNRPNRNMQFFFVNGRYVRLPAAAPALDNAYKNSIMIGKFPMCFLFLTIDPKKTDVNVHPTKTEIRFSDETKLYETVFYAARAALSAGDNVRPTIPVSRPADLRPPTPQGEQLQLDLMPKQTGTAAKGSAAQAPAGGVFHASEPPVFDKHPPEPRQRGIDVTFDTLPSMDRKTQLHDGAGSSPDEPSGHQLDAFFPAPAAETSAAAARPLSSNEEVRKVSLPVEPPRHIINSAAPEASYPERFLAAEPPRPEKAPSPAVVIGEIYKTYILVQQDDALLIIDKHAAHERMIYNALCASREIASQLLLTGVHVTLSGREHAAVLENLEVFAKAGYEIEDFGGSDVVVRACPVELSGADAAAIADVVVEMAGELVRGNRSPVPEKLDWLFHSTACRAAVKGGDDMSAQEMQHFVDELLSSGDIKYCPHGRPVCYEIKKQEIERRFGRLG